MAIIYLTAADLIVGAGHPSYPDTKNAAGIYIHTQMLAGHDSNGQHLDRQHALVGLQGTFTGNGAARTITLSNTNLVPYCVECWELQTIGELCTNGGFASDVTGWTVGSGGTAASVAGGQSGNCCELTQGTSNLIVNGEFETDMTGWSVTIQGGGAVNGGIAGGQSGNCCQSVTASGTVSNAWGQTFLIPHMAAYKATASWYLKSDDSSNFATYFNNVYVNHTPGASWGALSRTVSSSNIMTFGFYDGISSRTAYVDSVTLYDFPVITQDITTIPGRTYTVSLYVKSGTSGDEYYNITAGGTSITWGTTTSSWTQATATFEATAATTPIGIYKATNTAGTMLFDTVSVTELEAPQYIRLNSFAAGESCKRENTAMVTTGISALSTGSFSVLSTSKLNTSGIANYYTVLGVDLLTAAEGDAGAGTDPTWIVNGSSMIGYTGGTGAANSVEKHIEDAYLHEHTDAGAHNPNLYTGYGRFAQGTYVGTGIDSRAIVLTDTTIDIKDIVIIRSGAVAYSKSEDMAGDTAKLETTAAFQANYIQSVGTGTFEVGSAANATGIVYHYFIIGVL